jgi:RNA polymerase sigma factor (sigma-70 family)
MAAIECSAVALSNSHPFEKHEAAFQSLIRLEPRISSAAREAADAAVAAAYATAIATATRLCERVDLNPAEQWAGEAVNELFCQLRPHRAKGYDPTRPLWPYILMALRSTVFGFARRERRERCLRMGCTREDRIRDPIEEARCAEVADLVRSLPSELSDAVRLRYLEDMTPAEVASRLGVTKNAVNIRTHRGIALLRRRLE